MQADASFRARQRHSLGALLVAALAACAPAVAPTEGHEPALRPLAIELDAAAISALAELLRMEDVRTFEPAVAAAHAQHRLAFVRSRAALAVGRVKDRAATPMLLMLLRDEDVEVRASAAFGLGLLADSSAAVTAALAELAADPNGAAAAVEAVAALGRIGTPDAFAAVEHVIELAGAPAGPPPRRGAPPPVIPSNRLGEALLTIWKFPRSAAAADRMVPLLTAADPEIRWRATYALMRWSDPRTEAALRQRLEDTDPLTRALAARALRGPFVDSAGTRDAARAGLRLALADPHPHVRINASRALASFGEAATVPAIAGLLADADSNVVLAAVDALGTMGPFALAPIRQVAQDGGARPTIRAAALAPLFRHAPDDALAAALAMARHEDGLARLYGARSLANGGWDVAGPTLRELTRDSDPLVAAAAFNAIGALAPAGSAQSLLTGGVASPSPGVRAAAIRAIQRNATATDLPLLLEAYAAAQDDAENFAALAAVDALGALAAAGVPVARSFFVRFQPPVDAAVRRRVVQRLGADGRPDWQPHETPRTLQWYAGIVRRHVAPVLAGGPPPRVAIDGPTGTIVLELDPVEAPITVDNFLSLAGRGYFDARQGREPRWHRVVPNFVLQDGDPRGDGTGPGYSIRDELNRLRFHRGVLGMALSGPDTGGSQWFITHAPQPHLDGGYTVFGRVVEGMDAADRVVQDEPLRAIRVLNR